MPQLNDSITEATMRRKPDRVTLTLRKTSEGTWWDLQKKK
jgi:hypothetical protein